MDDMRDDSGLFCPKCHWPVEPADRFCEECGQALPEQNATAENDTATAAPDEDRGLEAASTAQELRPAAQTASLPEPTGAGPADQNTAAAEHTSLGQLDTIAEAVDKKITQKIALSETILHLAEKKNPPRAVDFPSAPADLPVAPVVEVDYGQELQCGLNISLRARVKVPDSSNLQVVLMVSGDDSTNSSNTMGLDYHSGPLCCCSKSWTEIDALWRVPMDMAPGSYRAHWKLICNGCRFEGWSHHHIFPDDAKSNPSLNQTYNITVTNTNHIQGHANDAKTSDSPININGPNLSSATVARIYRNSQTTPRWQSLFLSCTSCFGPPRNLPEPPSDACQKRLTILLNGKRLHLVSGDEISIGRARSEDIVARCLSQDYKPLTPESRLISNEHAVLRRDTIDGSLRYTDHSTNGSKLNDKDCHQASSSINADEIYTLGLGLSNSSPPALQLQMQALSCKLPAMDKDFCTPKYCSGRCSAVFLKRTDEIPEVFAVVWCHFVLSSGDSSWPEVSLWRIGEAFAWHSVKGSGWLEPGKILELPDGRSAFIQNFSQIGIDKK